MTDLYTSYAIGTESGTDSGGIAAVKSAIATLVADGASPTQAHVNTLNAAAQAAGLGVASAAVFVNVDLTKVGTASVLRVLLERAYDALKGALPP
jgi:hypothetical protein